MLFASGADNEHFSFPPPPPPSLGRRAAAGLTALLLALPAAVQAQPMLEIGYGSSGASNIMVLEESLGPNNGCLDIQLKADQTANNVRVHLIAYTVSRPDRLRNRGVEAYKVNADQIIRSSDQFVRNLTTAWTPLDAGRGICIGDNRIKEDLSEIHVVLMRAPNGGYEVGTQRSIDISVLDRDTCGDATAIDRNGGAIYRVEANGQSCTCATESRVSDVRRALEERTYPTPGDDERYGTDDDGTAEASPASMDFLKSLARNFHDPSYLYCNESPYKGLPGPG